MQTGTKDPVNRVGSPAIVARRLTKRFGEVTAVDGLSFEAVPGKVTGFVGPNGAGKSTTLRMLLGLVEPDDGSATILGLPYASLEDPITVAGAVLEVQSFHPLRSGRNHLRVLAAAAEIGDARVDEVLEVVGMTAAARRKAGSYSLGMRQRLGLAAALLGDPGVLMLDEPVNGLDPEGIHWIRGLLRALAAEGRTVFVSSHLISEIALTADHLVVIGGGRLLADTSVAELSSRAGSLEEAFLALTAGTAEAVKKGQR
jgi:ABC-2 type transport system ATP-binding protein